MNSYEKLLRLRRMKAIKIISTVTAMSMAVTSLVIAASADEADADKIALALGDLTKYGVVADTFDGTNDSDFESNFAVNHFIRGARFTSAYYADTASRIIDFNISTDIPGEQKYYYAVYENNTGEIVNVNYTDNNGVTTASSVLAVQFTGKGTKTFTVTVPEEHKYSELIVHELVKDETAGTYRVADDDNGVILKAGASNSSELRDQTNTSIIAHTLTANSSHFFGTDKVLYFGSELYSQLEGPNNDGRYIIPTIRTEGRWDPNAGDWGEWVVKPVLDENGDYIWDKREISERGTVIYPLDNDNAVDELLARIDQTSELIANFNTTGDKVLLLEIKGSSYKGSENDKKISEAYEFTKNHPEYLMIVNVTLDGNYNLYEFTYAVGERDVDTASRVIFNFIGAKSPEETTVAIGNHFAGSVVAPNATVKNVSTIIGAIYASKFVLGGDEIHFAPYRYGALLNEYIDGHQNDAESSQSEESVEESSQPDESTDVSSEPEKSTEESSQPEETTENTQPEESTEESSQPEESTVESSEPVLTTPATTTTPVTTVTTPATTPTPVTTVTTPATTTTPVTTVTTPATTTTPVTTVTTPATTTTPVTTVTTPATTTTPVTTVSTPATTTTPVTTVSTPATTTTPVTTTTTPVTTISTPVTTTTTAVTTPPPPEENTTTPPPEVTTDDPDVTTVSDITSETEPDDPDEVTTDIIFDTEPDDPDVTTSDVTSVTQPDEPDSSSVVLIEIPEDDIPMSDLIIIDEDIPLGDLPVHTGVDNNMTLFIIVGGAALLFGVGAQVYTVVLKKKH